MPHLVIFYTQIVPDLATNKGNNFGFKQYVYFAIKFRPYRPTSWYRTDF